MTVKPKLTHFSQSISALSSSTSIIIPHVTFLLHPRPSDFNQYNRLGHLRQAWSTKPLLSTSIKSFGTWLSRTSSAQARYLIGRTIPVPHGPSFRGCVRSIPRVPSQRAPVHSCPPKQSQGKAWLTPTPPARNAPGRSTWSRRIVLINSPATTARICCWG